jgi:signal transduction histidine kinase
MIVAAHRIGASMPHFVWGANDRDVRRTRPRLIGDANYEHPIRDQEMQVVAARPKSALFELLAPLQQQPVRAACIFPFASGGTRGMVCIPLSYHTKVSFLREMLGENTLEFLTQLSSMLGQSIESSFVSAQATGALDALAHSGHELDSPVAALTSTADEALVIARRIVSRSDDPTSSATRSYLTDLRKQLEYYSDSLTSIVSLGTLVGRFHDRKVVGRREAHLLRSIINAAIWGVRDEIRHGKIRQPRTLRFQAPKGDTDILLVCDRVLVEVALRNIYRNAAKYSIDDGNMVVPVTTEVTLSGKMHPVVRINIANVGIHIPNNADETMFEPFVRLASGPGHERRGMGLGLYLARQVARTHFGDVLLDEHESVGRQSRPSHATPDMLLSRYRTVFSMTLSADLEEGDYAFSFDS